MKQTKSTILVFDFAFCSISLDSPSSHVCVFGGGGANSLQSYLTLCDPMSCSPVARQAPLSMGILQAKYWSGLPCPPPGDLHDPGVEPVSLKSPALGGKFFTPSTT